jgi:hypothetical protein
MRSLKRREIIALLGCGAGGLLLVARAQPSRKLPAIGFLGADASGWSPWTAAFVQRLAELGWIDGRTITIDYRWSEGRREHDIEVAAEFVKQKVDVIVSHGAAVPALKQATSAIPIVFAIALDPVGAGLVTNLARPGGNVTGCHGSRAILAASGWRIVSYASSDPRRRCAELAREWPDAWSGQLNTTLAESLLAMRRTCRHRSRACTRHLHRPPPWRAGRC